LTAKGLTLPAQLSPVLTPAIIPQSGRGSKTRLGKNRTLRRSEGADGDGCGTFAGRCLVQSHTRGAFIDVRHAPVASKFRFAPKCRDRRIAVMWLPSFGNASLAQSCDHRVVGLSIARREHFAR